jgi:hypothetical protein
MLRNHDKILGDAFEQKLITKCISLKLNFVKLKQIAFLFIKSPFGDTHRQRATYLRILSFYTPHLRLILRMLGRHSTIP